MRSVFGWRIDPLGRMNGGQHYLVPVLTSDYIEALEIALNSATRKTQAQNGADSSAVMGVRKSLGIVKSYESDPYVMGRQRAGEVIRAQAEYADGEQK